MRQIAEPDETINHFPEASGGCVAMLAPAEAISCTAPQVFDLTGSRPLIDTEYPAYACASPRYDKQTMVTFPEDASAPVQ